MSWESKSDRINAPDFYIRTDFKIIHEDDDLLVVDKPAPLAVHPVGSYFERNLHTLLKKDPRWADTKLHFAHRLDAETSGVIVAAKNYEAARFLGIEFLNGRVEKRYHALVFGVPAQARGQIDFPLGNDKSSGFQTVRVIDAAGETASTRYRVLESWEGEDGAYSALEVEPLTGRTHQIRAHLSFIGHAVVGDKIYIDLNIFSRYVVHGIEEQMLQRVKLPRLALHASSIAFTHPASRERVVFVSAAPDFKAELAARGVQERGRA